MIQLFVRLQTCTMHVDYDSIYGGYDAPADLYKIQGYTGADLRDTTVRWQHLVQAHIDDPRNYV